MYMNDNCHSALNERLNIGKYNRSCSFHSFEFLTRDSIIACLARCMLSPVRLSVCHTDVSYETVEGRIMKLSLYGSPIPLVFCWVSFT